MTALLVGFEVLPRETSQSCLFQASSASLCRRPSSWCTGGGGYGFKPDLASAAPTWGCRRPRHQNGVCELMIPWVTPSTFNADPQMPRTSLNCSLNESLFSAINDFNYRPFKYGSVVAMPNLRK